MPPTSLLTAFQTLRIFTLVSRSRSPLEVMGEKHRGFKMDNMRINLARLFMLVAIVSGVLGLIVGLADKTWRYGSVGYFTGGTLLAVLSLVVLADEYFARKNGGS